MALPTWIYPIDPTGNNPDNLVAAEPQTLDTRRFRVIALNNGAFYGDSVVITDVATGLPLNSTQWYPSILYPQPSQQFGFPAYAVIVVTDPSVSQNVTVKYQVVGGEYSYSQEAAVTQINALNLDNRPIAWPNVIDTPSDYPPAPHYQNFDTLYGMDFLINAIYMLGNAIMVGNAPVIDQVLAYVDSRFASGGGASTEFLALLAEVNAHIADDDNPHDTTAAQVGAYSTDEIDTMLAALLAHQGALSLASPGAGFEIDDDKLLQFVGFNAPMGLDMDQKITLNLGVGMSVDPAGNLVAGGTGYINAASAATTTLVPGPWLMDTLTGSFVSALPAHPTVPTLLTFMDPTNNWGTTNWTLGHNGNTIMGTAEDLVLNISDQKLSIWWNGTDWRLL
jgi:hypothetical protein